MRRLIWFSLLVVLMTCAQRAKAQPPSADITINQTRVRGGTSGDVLIVNPNGSLGQQIGSGGTCSSLGGDVTGTCAANTVTKVNNGAVPTSAGALGTDANGQLISVTPGGGTTPGTQANQISSGCGVEYVSGLTFNVGACTYTIGGQQYTSPITSVTLSAADPSNPRIDVIHVNNQSVVDVLVGTPAATPAQPVVDYSTELPLNIVLVPAGGTTPTGIATTTIYDENTEWTSTCSTHINCASTSNPFRGTKDIEATAAVLGNNFTLVKPAAGTVDLSTQNTLIFYIRSKAAWPTANNTGANGLRTLSLFWLNGSTQVGLQVVLKDGAYGFNSSNTSAYQQIAIPLGANGPFATGSNLVTTLKAQVTGNGGTSSFGWYIDAVSIQSGQAPISLPTSLMNFRGTWNSTANYNVNDTVVSGGAAYIALAANTNVAVSTTSTWAATSTPCPTCVTAASALTANLPVFGAGSQAAAVGTRSGNTTEVATASGTWVAGNCVTPDSNGNLIDSGIPCSGGGAGGGTGGGGNIVTANWSTLGSLGTRTNNTNSITSDITTNGTNTIYGVSHTVAAGDFTIFLSFLVALQTGAAGPPAILAGFTDGTKTEGLGVDLGTGQATIQRGLSDTAISGGTTAAANEIISGTCTCAPVNIQVNIKLTRVGTALAAYFSLNNGISYVQYFNDHTSPFLTASSIAVYFQTRGSNGDSLSFTLTGSSLP